MVRLLKFDQPKGHKESVNRADIVKRWIQSKGIYSEESRREWVPKKGQPKFDMDVSKLGRGFEYINANLRIQFEQFCTPPESEQ